MTDINISTCYITYTLVPHQGDLCWLKIYRTPEEFVENAKKGDRYVTLDADIVDACSRGELCDAVRSMNRLNRYKTIR